MTTGTYNFVSVILNVALVGLLISAPAGLASRSASLVVLFAITQFPDQVKIRFISQLINGIYNVHPKLLTYFNGTTISKKFSVFLSSNPPVILVL